MATPRYSRRSIYRAPNRLSGPSDYGKGVPLVAVIGGIGSGKTVVTDYLVTRGAVVVDADVVAREVVEPGQPALEQLRDAFGDAVLTGEGAMDRAFVAEIVFHDPSALRRLNHITHGAIGVELVKQIADAAQAPLIVVALPLFRPIHRELFRLDEVWCVYTEPELAIKRLVEFREFDEGDARARLANQPTNEVRISLSDRIFDNSGTIDDLHAQVNVALMDKSWLGG